MSRFVELYSLVSVLRVVGLISRAKTQEIEIEIDLEPDLDLDHDLDLEFDLDLDFCSGLYRDVWWLIEEYHQPFHWHFPLGSSMRHCEDVHA